MMAQNYRMSNTEGVTSPDFSISARLVLKSGHLYADFPKIASLEWLFGLLAICNGYFSPFFGQATPQCPQLSFGTSYAPNGLFKFELEAEHTHIQNYSYLK